MIMEIEIRNSYNTPAKFLEKKMFRIIYVYKNEAFRNKIDKVHFLIQPRLR